MFIAKSAKEVGPERMRIVTVLMAACLFALPANATKPTPDEPVPALAGGPLVVETNTYRFGDTYRSERGTSGEACAKICNGDPNCAAWSLTPATFKMGPRCELKTNPGTASHRPGAVSGMTEALQMDPVRDAIMRYQIQVPESRQPAAVPLDQLRPSPVLRTFGDPLPKTAPELLGGPGTKISTVLRPEAQAGVTPSAPAAPLRINAVLKPEGVMVASPDAKRVAASASTARRTPWTERASAAVDYSVGDTTYVPGDEDIAGGTTETALEAGS